MARLSSAPAAGVEGGRTLIQPRRGRPTLGLGELWSYRELLYFFVWRDIKVRYKQTVLGASWAVIQPLVTMVIFSIFFGRLAGVSSNGFPYPVFAFAALVPWGFFSQGVTQAAGSLVGSQNLLKKVYFPRMVIPASAVLSGLVDYVLAFVMLLAIMLAYHIVPGYRILWTVPLLAVALLTAFGVGLWLSALNVRYRDVRYVVPFLVQIWLFATPIAYPVSVVPERWRTLYALNPMVGVVAGFREALLGERIDAHRLIAASAIVAVLLVVSGTVYFRRVEATFADVV